MILIRSLTVAFLAHANGANANFKGVAGPSGSKTCGYRTGIAWATVTRQAKWKTVLPVLASWIVTLSVAASLATAFYQILPTSQS